LRNIADDGFFKRNSFIITVLVAYAVACASPLWGLGFGSHSLIFWSGYILLLLG
jgi:hypothetical protein